MTENSTPTGGPEGTVEADTGDTPHAETGMSADTTEVNVKTDITENADDSTDRKLSDEAARHRIAARAAETKLAVAEARIAELQRTEANRILGTRLASPDDAWLMPEVTLDSMLADDGTVDPQLVNEVADNILESKPHWRTRPQRLGAPASAVTGDGKAPQSTPQPGWSELLRAKTAG